MNRSRFEARRPERLIAILALAAALTLITGFGSHRWWICDLLANLRIHAAAALLFLSAAYLLRRHPMPAWTVAIVLTGALLFIPPDGAEIAVPEGDEQSRSLVIVSYNLGDASNDFHKARDFLRSTAADMLILQEYNFDWHERLAQLAEPFPYVVTEPRDGYFGIALFSRRPLSGQAVVQFPGSRIPYIQATVTLGGRQVDVLGVHLQWPMLPSSFAERNRQIEHIIDRIGGEDRPIVVCGDWNTTPWSGWYRQMSEAGLSSGAAAARFFPTWPAAIGWLGIPIDHCFTTGNLGIDGKRIGPSAGSDHRPISVSVDAGGASPEERP